MTYVIQGIENTYLYVISDTNTLQFTSDINSALRYSTKEEAQAIVDRIVSVYPNEVLNIFAINF